MKPLGHLTVLALALLATPALAGLEMVETDGYTTLFSEGRVKTIPAEGDEPISLLDSQRGTVTFIMPAEQTYAEGTAEELCRAVEAMQKQAMADLSEQERQMMERYMGAQGAAREPEVRVEHRGEGGEILGYATEHYAVFMDGALYEELWITTDPGLLAEVGDHKALVNLSTAMSSCITDSPGLPPDPGDSAPYLELMSKGLALKTVEYAPEGSMSDTVRVRRLRTHTIPESQFRAPADFRKIGLEKALQMGME